MAGDQYWDKYFPKTRDQLIAMQQPDGSWNGDGIGQVYGTADRHHHLAIAVQVSAGVPAVGSSAARFGNAVSDIQD